MVFLDIILNHFLNFDNERGEEWSGRSRKKIFIFRLFFDLFCFIIFFCVNSKFCHFQEKLKSTERKYFWKRKFSMQKSLNFFRWDGQTKIIIAVHIFTLERMKETCFNQTFWWFHLNNVEHILVQNKFLSFSNVNIKMPKRWERTIFLGECVSRKWKSVKRRESRITYFLTCFVKVFSLRWPDVAPWY